MPEKISLYKQTGIRIPKELKKQAEELAEKQHRSFNNLVTYAIMQYIENSK